MVKNIPPHTGLVENCAPSETGVARPYNISGLRPDGILYHVASTHPDRIPHHFASLWPDGIPHYIRSL